MSDLPIFGHYHQYKSGIFKMFKLLYLKNAKLKHHLDCSVHSVILLPAHPASFAHKFLFQRVPGCNSIADLSLKTVFRTHKFAVGTH